MNILISGSFKQSDDMAILSPHPGLPSNDRSQLCLWMVQVLLHAQV